MDTKEGRAPRKEQRVEGYQGSEGGMLRMAIKEERIPRRIARKTTKVGRTSRKEGRISRKEGHQGMREIKKGRKGVIIPSHSLSYNPYIISSFVFRFFTLTRNNMFPMSLLNPTPAASPTPGPTNLSTATPTVSPIEIPSTGSAAPPTSSLITFPTPPTASTASSTEPSTSVPVLVMVTMSLVQDVWEYIVPTVSPMESSINRLVPPPTPSPMVSPTTNLSAFFQIMFAPLKGTGTGYAVDTLTGSH
jgi:hypothetical protein